MTKIPRIFDNNNPNSNNLFAITQSVMAILIVIGTGIAIILDAPGKDSLIPVASVVAGYYFTDIFTDKSEQTKEETK